MRALSVAEKAKRGCEYCACCRKMKLAKALENGVASVTESIRNIKTQETIMVCPFAKCRFTELNGISNYERDYDAKNGGLK